MGLVPKGLDLIEIEKMLRVCDSIKIKFFRNNTLFNIHTIQQGDGVYVFISCFKTLSTIDPLPFRSNVSIIISSNTLLNSSSFSYH